jgi:F-type H+-transporting ATPase subunit epsilon
MASGNIRLEIVTPEKSIASEDAQIVMAPGTLGEFGILIGHTPFMSTLKMGTIRYVDANSKERFVFISGGFAEALPDRVTVLAESAERRSDIDVDRAKSALQRAQERLALDGEEEIDVERAKQAMERALQRLKITDAKT